MNRIRRTLLVALSSLSLAGSFTACGPKPESQTANDEGTRSTHNADMPQNEAIDRYIEQKAFSYCDARVLAQLWDVDVYDAKADIGRRTDTPELQADMDRARDQAMESGFRCDYDDAGFTYYDAEMIAEANGMADAWEAKVWIADKITAGREGRVHEVIDSITPQHHVEELDENVLYMAFETSDYDYCDATLLAASWSSAPYDAQIAIGYKVVNGYIEHLEAELTAARDAAFESGARCDWSTAVLYNDVDILAKHWGLSMDETKVKLGDLVTANQDDQIWAALRAAHKIPAFAERIFDRGYAATYELNHKTVFEEETKVSTAMVRCRTVQVQSMGGPEDGLFAVQSCNDLESGYMEGYHAFFADQNGLWLSDPKADPAYIRERMALLPAKPKAGEKKKEEDGGAMGVKRTISASDKGGWCAEVGMWGGDEVWENVCVDADGGVRSLGTGWAGGGTNETTYKRVE